MSTTPSAGGGAATTITGATAAPDNNSTPSLGYAISIALGVVVLFSIATFVTYVCCRHRRRRLRRNPNPNANSDGIILPRIIFVAENDGGDGDENAAVGLDAAVISSYPKFPFHRSSDGGNSETACSICLCEYRDSEMLRMMPDCRHLFHLLCLDAWLKLNGSCPVCRNSPLPTPLSTPLAEVVPLSQYRR